MNYKQHLELADAYIKENAANINKRYRHTYHAMPPVGWMNDPNGFSLFKDTYHLFYQFYPYSAEWGPMFWGHVTSSDLMNWEVAPTALAPSNEFDKQGIFSGSALEVDGELWAYYTGHNEEFISLHYDEFFRRREESLSVDLDKLASIKQVQCLAVSSDGVTFEKRGEVVGSEMIRQNGRTEDFRDPKVWKHGNRFYMVCGSKSIHLRAQVLFYVSDDGINWEYLNYFSLGKEYGTVWECPDIFELGGKHILIVSPQGKPVIEDTEAGGGLVTMAKYENMFTTFAFVGDFEYETGQFSLERVQDFDYGFDFYAPQSFEDKDKNRVLVAWMNMWGRAYVLQSLNHGWNGAVTIPRKLSLKNDKVYQYPIDSVKDYRQAEMILDIDSIDGHFTEERLYGDAIDLEIDFNMSGSKRFSIELFKGNNAETDQEECLKLIFDKERDEVTIDRSSSFMINESHNKAKDYVRKIYTCLNRTIKLRVLLDVSSCEVFINDGEFAMTTLFYKSFDVSELHFHSEGITKINRLAKWDMKKSLKNYS